MTQLTAGSTWAWVNGVPGAQVSIQDRGFQYGDGLFETMRVQHRRVRFLELHLQRLRDGCERLLIQGVDHALIRDELTDAAAMSEEAILKLIVTRGEAARRGYDGRHAGSPSRVMTLIAGLPPAPDSAQIGISQIVLGDSPALSGIKHLNRLENVLARTTMPTGLDEVLLCDRRGAIISGSMTNVFVVSGATLLTPRLDRCGVAGVMRQVVMREARDIGFTVRDARFAQAELDHAAEIFLTNARIGVWPVSQCLGRSLGVGAATRALRERLDALDATGYALGPAP